MSTDRSSAANAGWGGGDEVLTPAPPRAELGPIRPPTEVRSELVAFLEQDASRLGEVYRCLQRGLTADDIASELEVSTSGFVWMYERRIRSLLDGDLPTAPTVALAVARKFRSMLKTGGWSETCRAYLEHNLAELERRASDESARSVEVLQAKAETEKAEAQNDVGIYVYALPHYLLHPYEPDSGRTLMKVGRSDSDVIVRFRNQTRTTALPEEPVLLRIYRTDPGAAASAETTFHRLLEAADHHRSVARTAGREWFVTSTRFLDEVARALSLSSVIVNEAEVTDD
ncbi:GIY-YIG nuclease family protein [Rhodococcus pyridinivorans]|uniref:GIY-YIG nuclease family protein n=1 Tax=Rhodococcus TaxID=1827 RepID=UPI0012EBA9E3|nr:GIY-YIG nuclease family protein [Rhodococcus sp. 2G]